jgi:alpha-glucoside transport system substrate-binding protein
MSMESFGASGWVGTDWIEDIVLRLHGSEVYDEWAAGAISFEDDRIADAFAAFDEVALVPGKVHGGARRILNTPWQEAAHPMFDDPPGCLLHRQTESYRAFLPSGIEFGEDVDVFVLPAMGDGSPPLLVSGELATSLSDRPEVHEFLTFLATPEASAVWGAEGGHLSPLADLDAELYAEDEFARRMAELVAGAEVLRFDASDIMDPRVGTGTFWEGMVNLVRTRDVERVLTEIQSGYVDS